MGIEGKVCKKGIWDESVPGIEFDEEGISNYARLYEHLVEEYPRGDQGKKKWEVLLNMIKTAGKRGRYDCVIGVSGGTDSSYLLYLAKEFGLRPLAVNLDNGWNSDISVKNIKKITSSLEVDLETYVIDYEEIKDLQRAYMLSCLPWIDSPTDSAIKAVLYKIADREGIKFVLRGNDFRSEGSQPKEWTYGDNRLLRYIHKKHRHVKLKTFPEYSIRHLVYYGIVKKIKSIYPYYYLDYDKTKSQEFLKLKFGWEYYGGHHHENIFTKFAISYWLYEKFGIDKRKITYSALIMNGELDRDVALREIEKKPYNENEVNYMLDYVCKKLDFSRKEFDTILKSPNHSYKDFPSNDYLLTRLIWLSKPMLKLIFLHKPQSLFQSEMRKNS